MTGTSTQREGPRRLWLLVGLCLVLFFFNLGSRALWDVDEGMHSAIAKHVVQSGDWVTPTFNGEAFFDKPMLFTWLVAISFHLFGLTETAARLPAALVGLACVLVTYLLGKKMFGVRAGLFGGAILATTILFLVMSRTVVHDITLVLFTTLALHLFYLGATEENNRKRHFLLFYVALAGAVLAKGPLGAVLPALVIVPFLVLTKRLQLIREMQLGWGVLIFLALASPWYVLMSLRNEGYLYYFLIEKNFGSFASAGSTHPAPFHFYVPVLLGALLPWTFFLPAAVYRAARGLRGEKRDELLYLLLWLGVMFLFFSLAVSKLASYLLPLMPAAALLLALPWNDFLSSPTRKLHRTLVWSLLPMLILMAGSLVYVWLKPPVSLEARYGMTLMQVFSLTLLIIGALGVAVWFLLQRRARATFGSIVAMVAIILVLFTLWYGPAMDPFRSTRDLSLQFDQMLGPAEPMHFLRRIKDSALFYTDREGVRLPTPEAFERHMAAEREVFCMVDLRYLDRVLKYRSEFGFVARSGNTVILSNDPSAERQSAVPEGIATLPEEP